MPTAPIEITYPLPHAISCRADVSVGTILCRGLQSEPVPGLSLAVIVGGQGTYVYLSSTNVSYDGSSLFQADVTVQDLLVQPLGTPDGTTVTGIKVFFHTGPTVTSGDGTVAVANADGTGTFTGSEQPYFEYSEMVQPQATSSVKTWQWNVPPSVTTFEFSVYVSAEIPHEDGLLTCTSQSEIPTVECEALAALYNNTNGPAWANSTNWLATSTPCGWSGVYCTSGSVTSLFLDDNDLSGSIPPELGNLSNLKYLHLEGNQLSGAIPPGLGNLSSLVYLYLYENQLSGAIPPELGNLSSLMGLHLHVNQLSDTIPPELGDLASLTVLDLGLNDLTGSIPPELGNLSNLRALRLDRNQLSDTTPPELGGLGDLRYLWLYMNQLSGTIPPELGSLSDLRELKLHSNQLSGTVPPELGNLGSLEDLNLGDNQLSGTIPTELGNLGSLNSLQLDDNQLSGTIPSSLGNLNTLSFLWLQNNQLTGLVPLEVAVLGDPLLSCYFVPGNGGLYMPDTPEYRGADVDGDGLICGLGFTP